MSTSGVHDPGTPGVRDAAIAGAPDATAALPDATTPSADTPPPRDATALPRDATAQPRDATAPPRDATDTAADSSHAGTGEDSYSFKPLADTLLVPQPPLAAGRVPANPVTLYDVARLAGVSTATVSRVVHGQDRVADATRARVRDVIEQLGYVPDGAAQSLSRRQKNVIGLVGVERLAPHQYDIESMSLLFYDEILRGVEQRIRYHNWSLMITYLREESDDDLRRLQALSGKVDGLLIGEGIVPSDELARLAERLPVVVVAGDPAEQAADVVTADNRSGSAALVSHLVEDHRRRRIFHVDGPPSAPDAKERRLALNDVIRSHPGTELVGSYSGRFSVQSGEEAGEILLANRAELPDAVVCANDQMAIGILQALSRGGVRVPEQLSVVGFDDIFPGSLFDPSLTTVHQPMRLLGERACNRLLDRIFRPDLPTQVELLPTELVLRKSCGCPPGTAARTAAVAPLLAATAAANAAANATRASLSAAGTALTTLASDFPVTSRGRRRARPATES
jgi:LacI family transcriptional regulator